MDKIFLFSAGGYQLGIDAGCVTAISQEERYLAEINDEGRAMNQVIDLGAILSPESATSEQNGAPVIEVTAGGQSLALLIDTIEEGEAVTYESGRMKELPPVFEGLSNQCFPGVFIYNKRPSLLLDPESMLQFLPVSKDDKDIVSEDDSFVSTSPEESLEAEDTQEVEYKADQTDNPVESEPEEIRPEANARKKKISIDDASLRCIIKDVIQKYKKLSAEDKEAFKISEMSVALAKEKGIAVEAMEYLVEKILVKLKTVEGQKKADQKTGDR
jgi:hypothetical protein